MTHTAYSYTRFSTPEQKKGDSLRRQLAASEAYAEAHGLELDTSLRDEGLSGFTGANRTKGALGAFLKRVEIGKIPRGSVLIVEALDRLTREEIVEAVYLFLGIIRAGITIVTLIDGMRYEPGKMNSAELIISIIKLSEGGGFSEKLSYRLKEVNANKRERAAQGIRTRNHCPAWLRWNDGAYEIIEERAAAIRLIFELKASDMGKESITRKLNAMPIWHPQEHKANPGGWRPSYVEKLLHSRAVIGEYQSHKMVDGKRVPVGDAIPDYFPAIVDRDLFHRVQAAFARNAKIPGRGGGANGSIANVFGHIARCGRCGGTMVVVNKGSSPKGGVYLQCDKARRGLGCNKALLRYDRMEPLCSAYAVDSTRRICWPIRPSRRARKLGSTSAGRRSRVSWSSSTSRSAST